MKEKAFTFSTFSEHCSNGVSQALERLNNFNLPPVFICIGSDLVLGDSLGPLIGTLLKNKNVPCYVYGTLNFPITAKDIECAKQYIRQTHPSSILVAIDAAIGEEDDVGLIRVINSGLMPGLGVNKNLGQIGDVSIIGVVAGKSVKNKELFNLTRLNLVYNMAENIANGIAEYTNFKKYSTSINQTTFGA